MLRPKAVSRALPLMAAALLLPGAGTPLPGPGPESLQAQEAPRARVSVVPFYRSAGWLGVQFNVAGAQGSGEAAGEGSGLQVSRVVPGSPAESAGLQAGDLVTHLQGEPATPRSLRRHVAALEPGDPFRVRALRNGRVLELELEAGTRPDLILDRPSGEVMFLFADSLRDRFGLQADSIRHRFIVHADSVRAMVLSSLDSLRLMPEGDRWFRDQAWRFEELGRRFDEEGRRFDAEVFRRRALEGAVEGGVPPHVVIRTPGSIVTLGQRIVAGAEVAALNPGLAAYFGVEEGVLVTEVVGESPADLAGLRPGDVVVSVDGEAVRTVSELRDALARGYRSPPVPVTVVRDRRELRLEFGR